MKKLIFMLLLLLIPSNIWSAGVIDMTADTSPTSDDITYVINDPGGTPADRKVTLGNAITKAHGLTGINTVIKLGATNVFESAGFIIIAPTTGGILLGTGTGTYTPLAKGTAGQILNMNAGATAPQWVTDVGISTIVTVGALSAGSLATGFTPVTVPLGGTGASTFALNGVLYGNAANPIGVTAIGTAGQILKVGADPFVPVWTSSITGITLGGFTASKGLCSDGSGNAVACTNLTDVTPLVSGGALGTPASATLTNATGFPASPPGIVERLGATFDGGGSAIAVNKVAYMHVPFAVTAINSWVVQCHEDSGTTGIIITPYLDAYAEDTHPTTTMCTTGTAPHTTDGAGAGGKVHKANWDCNIVAIPADSMIMFKVTTAPTDSTWCSVTLKVTR